LAFIAIKAFIITINTINTINIINISSCYESSIDLSDKAREAFITLSSSTLLSHFKRIIVTFIAITAFTNLNPLI
jgi:hypothetical protein